MITRVMPNRRYDTTAATHAKNWLVIFQRELPVAGDMDFDAEYKMQGY